MLAIKHIPTLIPATTIAELKFSLAITAISGVVNAITFKKPEKVSKILLFMYATYDINIMTTIFVISDG